MYRSRVEIETLQDRLCRLVTMESCDRRRFLALTAAISAYLAVHPPASAAHPREPGASSDDLSPDERETLALVLDVLLPHDDTAPGATQLGLAPRLIAAAREVPHLPALLRYGLETLDTPGPRFAEASLDERNRRVARLAAEPAISHAGLFFVWTRRLAMTEYYADPRVLRAMGFPGPPQPNGHPHPWRAP